MNYNDISTRLKRIYTSINRINRYGGEILSGMHTDTIKKSGDKITMQISFGSDTDALNQIYEIISNLAKLKDFLKNRMEEQGRDKKLIEEDINKSIALKLIMDLSNQDKHGYPLENRRSEKDPQIKNVRFIMTQSNKPDNIQYSASNGAKALNVMISILADVVDRDGQHLCTFDELVERAITDWELIIKKHQI